MIPPPVTPLPEDRLRAVRLAVAGGRFREAWTELASLPDAVRRSAEGLLLGAIALWRLGDYAKSRAAAVQARDAFRAAGDADGEMRAANVAAAGAFARGSLAEAERGFTRALMLADQLADELMAARCANNLGNVAYYLAQHGAALGFYRLAIAAFERLASWKGLAEGWLNSAIVARETGELEASRDAADRAVDCAHRAEDARVFGQAVAARAETYALLGDLALAESQARHAHRLADQEDDPLGRADALRIQCLIARLAGDQARARDAGEAAVAAARRVEHPWTLAEAQRELGSVYEVVGRRDEAATHFRRAEVAFRAVGAAERAEQVAARAAALGNPR